MTESNTAPQHTARPAGRLGHRPRGWLGPRRGLTLIEVLMSIFVLAIGLFGVAALLPLGQKKMMEGTIDQRKGQVAQAAAEFLATQGGLSPARWVNSAGTPFDAVRVAPASRILCRVTAGAVGSVTTDATGLDSQDGAYNDCILEMRSGKLRGQRRLITAYTAGTKTFTFTGGAGTPSAPWPVNPSAGDAFSDANGNGRQDPGETYTDSNGNGSYDAPDTFVVYRTLPFALDPHLVAKLGSGAGDFALKLPRLTLSAGSGTATPMALSAAEYLTMSDDDLLFNAPVGNADPTQIYYEEPYNDLNGNHICDPGEFTPSIHDMNGNGTWDGGLKRKSALNMSWAATFVPTFGGSTDLYRVSFVVFYKRPMDSVGTVGGPTAVEVKFTGGGLSGGTAQLRAAAASGTGQADLSPVRAGHWVIVSSASGKEHRWYRILSIGTAFQDSTNGNRWTRDVTLAGGNWNATSDQTSSAVYYPSVVGVFERTMRIETLPDSG